MLWRLMQKIHISKMARIDGLGPVVPRANDSNSVTHDVALDRWRCIMAHTITMRLGSICNFASHFGDPFDRFYPAVRSFGSTARSRPNANVFWVYRSDDNYATEKCRRLAAVVFKSRDASNVTTPLDSSLHLSKYRTTTSRHSPTL